MPFSAFSSRSYVLCRYCFSSDSSSLRELLKSFKSPMAPSILQHSAQFPIRVSLYNQSLSLLSFQSDFTPESECAMRCDFERRCNSTSRSDLNYVTERERAINTSPKRLSRCLKLGSCAQCPWRRDWPVVCANFESHVCPLESLINTCNQQTAQTRNLDQKSHRLTVNHV